MAYALWQPGAVVNTPVYLDANVVVAYLINTHRLYRRSSRLMAELLAARSHMLFSILCFDESLWAVAKISFDELNYGGKGKSPYLTQESYIKNSGRIFSTYWARFNVVGSMAQDFATAGLPIEVVPKTETNLHAALGLTVQYMRQYQLTPADAGHLALAETNASTFVTADKWLATVFERGYSGNLTILHLT